jgi:hypothetical protein
VRKKAAAIVLASTLILGMTACSENPEERASDLSAIGEEVGVVERVPQVTVPNVLGLPTYEAAQVLKGEGFRSPALTEVPSDKPNGSVVAQSPRGGASLPVGSIVELYYSAGPSDE